METSPNHIVQVNSETSNINSRFLGTTCIEPAASIETISLSSTYN